MKKLIIGVVVGVVVLAGLVAALLLTPLNQSPNPNMQTSNPSEAEDQVENPADLPPRSIAKAEGRYELYSSSLIDDEGYDETILFFYAPWCPECRAFEQAINATGVPDGVQILKVDYDSSTELKQKYQITLQSTFVRIDSEGNHISTWVGYGLDKSVDVILENT